MTMSEDQIGSESERLIDIIRASPCYSWKLPPSVTREYLTYLKDLIEIELSALPEKDP